MVTKTTQLFCVESALDMLSFIFLCFNRKKSDLTYLSIKIRLFLHVNASLVLTEQLST